MNIRFIERTCVKQITYLCQCLEERGEERRVAEVELTENGRKDGTKKEGMWEGLAGEEGGREEQ